MCKEKHPKRQFSVKVGSIMEDSAIGIDKWLVAIWLISNAQERHQQLRTGARARRHPEVRVVHAARIRLAMQDETGGSSAATSKSTKPTSAARPATCTRLSASAWYHAGAGRHGGKVAVMGLLERHGDGGIARSAPCRHGATEASTLACHTSKPTSNRGATVYTDALPSYDEMRDRDYIHDVIDHAEAYVDGTVHTNGLRTSGRC